MEGFEQQIVSIGLDVIGYVVAAGLGALIYSTRRVKATAPVPATATPQTANCDPESTVGRRGERPDSFQFLNLRGAPVTRRTQTSAPLMSPDGAGRPRRDRVAMIREAREMLRAGTPGPTIQRRLPISDAELALLKTGNSD
jgi:hypothetical protein